VGAAPEAATGPAPAAGLVRRLAALLYDSLLLGAILVAIGFALLPLVGPRVNPAGPHSLYFPSASARLASLIFVVLCCGAYCVWLWSDGRRSLPMKTWRVALQTTAGSRVTLGTAAIRYAAWWIGPIVALAAYSGLESWRHSRWLWPLAGINYAWAILDRDGQFLHDRIAGTRLVYEGNTANSKPR
jgi:uncharacterized RDD family membrane protein YckC